MLTKIAGPDTYKEQLAEVKAHFNPDTWTIRDNGRFVYFINKKITAPEQGWKIHVSCLAKEISALLRIVTEVLAEEQVSFKILSEYDDILHFNAGEAGNSQIGKIITIYPANTEQACHLGLKLDHLWHGSPAPTPPSDLYFHPGGNVSVRFGAINNSHVVTHSDHITYPALIGPDAELVPDISSLNGTQVSWAPAFPVPLSGNAYFGREQEFLGRIQNGRYQVVYPLIKKTFTVTLLCIDTQDKKAVLIKIYSKRSEHDSEGNYFLGKAQNEVTIGRIMAEAGLGPRILATYDDEYFFYIVSQYIMGSNYAALAKEERLQMLPQLLEKMQQMHDLGIVHRDLKLANIMVTEGRLYFIDFELSALVGASRLFKGGTSNYIAPEAELVPAAPAYDSYSLASCLLHAYTGVDAAALPADIDCRVDAAVPYIPTATLALIRALYDTDPEARPAASACIKHIVVPENLVPSVPDSAHAEMPGRIDGLIKGGLSALAKYAISDGAAICWPSAHTSHNQHLRLGLNTGIGGTLLGLLAMLKTEGNARQYRQLVTGAAAYIEQQEDAPDIPPGLFTGLAGSALAMGAAAILYRNLRYLDISYRLLEKAITRDGDFDLFGGYAGIAIAAIRIYESCGQERFLDIATHCVDILLRHAETIDGMTAWPVNRLDKTPRYEPGAAHGTAGIALAIGLYGVASKSDTHLQIAVRCFKEIFRQARSEEKRCFTSDIGVPLKHPASNTIWCHGTSGYLWAIVQLPAAYDALKEEIDWTLRICSEVSHLSNPTYCHGMAGALELWRMLNTSSLRNEQTQRCFDNTLYELAHISQQHEGRSLFTSEYPELYSTDLWIGWVGTMSSLALAKMKSNKSILNAQW